MGEMETGFFILFLWGVCYQDVECCPGNIFIRTEALKTLYRLLAVLAQCCPKNLLVLSAGGARELQVSVRDSQLQWRRTFLLYFFSRQLESSFNFVFHFFIFNLKERKPLNPANKQKSGDRAEDFGGWVGAQTHNYLQEQGHYCFQKMQPSFTVV